MLVHMMRVSALSLQRWHLWMVAALPSPQGGQDCGLVGADGGVVPEASESRSRLVRIRGLWCGLVCASEDSFQAEVAHGQVQSVGTAGRCSSPCQSGQ